MKALVYESFGQAPKITQVADPETPEQGILLEVMASGICRSDWHGWKGHDPDIQLPHVPGHEFAGVILEVGKRVKNWKIGDRVTVPFVCACGSCPSCQSGNQQICDDQFVSTRSRARGGSSDVLGDHLNKTKMLIPWMSEWVGQV